LSTDEFDRESQHSGEEKDFPFEQRNGLQSFDSTLSLPRWNNGTVALYLPSLSHLLAAPSSPGIQLTPLSKAEEMRTSKPHSFEPIPSNNTFPSPLPALTYEELCQQEEATAHFWILFSNPSLLASFALSSPRLLLTQCQTFLFSSFVWIPVLLYAIFRLLFSFTDPSPTQQSPLASSVSWYTLALVVLGVLLLLHLLSTGLLLYRNTLQQEAQLRSLQNSIFQMIRTMSSLALPPEDGLKMMRYLLSIWIFKTCEVSPLRYLQENTFQPLNEKFFLLTVRERDILDQPQPPPCCPSPAVSFSADSHSGIRSELLLSWVHSYLYSAKLLSASPRSTPSLTMLHSSYLSFVSSLPTPSPPSASLLSVSLSLSCLLLHSFLILLALFLASSLSSSQRQSTNALQEILSVSLLLLISILFSSLHRLFSLLPSHSSFPLHSLWRETIQICRQTLSFATQRDVPSDQRWVYCDQIWSEEELEGSRPAAVSAQPFPESWHRESSRETERNAEQQQQEEEAEEDP
jgi:hypothetical protein